MKRLTKVSVSLLSLVAAQAAFAQATPGESDATANQSASPATTPREGGIEEIIVTATRQSTNLQRTPISITAVTSAALEERGLVRVSDLTFVVPNASFQRAQAAFGPGVTTTIRGIVSADTSLGGEATVAYYIDDVYYPILLGSNFDLLDIDRVEVLRGPQGTLFGRNALAGAVNIVSKQPNLKDASGYAEVSVGQFNRVDVRAGFNMPLSDTMGVMVSALSRKRTGYMKRLDFRCEMIRQGTPALAGSLPFIDTLQTSSPNFTPKDCTIGHLGGDDTRAVRGSFLWEPSSSVRLTITGDYTKDNSENVADKVVDIDPTRVSNTALANVQAQANYFGIAVDRRFVTNSPYTTYATYQDKIGAGTVLPLLPGQSATSQYYNGRRTRGGDIYSPITDLVNWGVSAKLVVDLSENFAVTAVGGYRKMDETHAFDTDGTPLVVEHTYANIFNEYYNAEVRLAGKFDWADFVLGAFYFDASGFNHALNPNPAAATYKVQNTTYEPNSKAVFANGTIRPFGDKLGIVVGARYSKDRKVVNFSNLLDITPNAADIAFRVVPKDSRFSWKLGLNYQATDTFMIYTSAATGFQLPGFNARPLQPSQVQSIDGFTNKAYEIGAKLDLFDRRLRINGAAFYTDLGVRPVPLAGGQEIRTGAGNAQLAGNQVLEPLPNAPAGLGATRCRDRTAAEIAANVPGFTCVGRNFYANYPAKIKGFELEGQANPIDGLNINFSVGYSKFTSQDISLRVVNQRLLNEPFWTAGGGIQYQIEADMIGGTLTPRVDWSYRGSRVSSGSTAKYNYLTPAYSVFNGRLTYANNDHDFTVAVGASNLFNKLFYRNVFDYQPLGYPQTDAQPAPPREWYLTVSKKF